RLWRKLQPLAIDEMPLDLPPPCTSRIGADAQNRITLSNFQEVRFTVDSPLEETGFEPPVPLLRKALPSAHPRRRHDKRSHLSSGRGGHGSRGALPGPFRSRWDREFESVFLQQRVRCEPDFWGRIPGELLRANCNSSTGGHSLRHSRVRARSLAYADPTR